MCQSSTAYRKFTNKVLRFDSLFRALVQSHTTLKNIAPRLYLGNIPYNINITEDLVHKVQDLRLDDHDEMALYDVTALLRVFACNSGTQMRVRDSSATRIFFKKNKRMQHRAQKITTKF